MKKLTRRAAITGAGAATITAALPAQATQPDMHSKLKALAKDLKTPDLDKLVAVDRERQRIGEQLEDILKA